MTATKAERSQSAPILPLIPKCRRSSQGDLPFTHTTSSRLLFPIVSSVTTPHLQILSRLVHAGAEGGVIRVIEQPLTQVLMLLISSVLVISLARRVGLPPILGYLAVGMTLGPLAIGLLPDSAATRALAEIGVVFLLFTLGLDFMWPRMVAMRREVFGLAA